ncbi:MAG TPA: aldo/keto reductase [Trebonia sp.]|jgi:aryl-alcohol dehydrogenase-like predicted oxidoreductase|nr:aldo/keto reductase [Trebonia sp.]
MSTLNNLGTTDIKVYPINLGGNVFGWTADKDQSFAVLDAYTEAGGNFVDTSDNYSFWVPGHTGGESEEIIGEWLAARQNRDDVVIATKGGRYPELTGLKADTLTRALDASLRRLGTDHIDLYYTHFDDESVPVEEIISTLDGFVKAGKVRAIAASNITPQRLRAAQEFALREGLTAYAALQPHYNLVSRDTYEGELQDIAAEYNLGVLPYYGLAGGFLTGKYRPGAASIDSGRVGSSFDPSSYLKVERAPKVITALDEVAQARGVEIATVALAWLAAQPTITAPIASARTTAQLPALFAAAELQLTDGDLAKLNEASA